MIKPFTIPRHGIVLPGHDILRADARAQAARMLVDEHGWTAVQADDATESAGVERAWWADDLLDDEDRTGAFVGADHPQGVLVTVVNIPSAP